MEYGLGQDLETKFHGKTVKSLNPCCNGRWSRTDFRKAMEDWLWVLILVVMEDDLWQPFSEPSSSTSNVLILVVMEDDLWPLIRKSMVICLKVLILVVMEYGLWQDCERQRVHTLRVLILVVMEYGLWHYEYNFNMASCCPGVLILVVMEDGLW